LTKWVLGKRIHHRQAATVRGLVSTWVALDEHEKLANLEARIEQLEKDREVREND
jgi:hypothetical protein